MCVSRTITTAWRVRRHAPCVNRLFQLREVSDHSKYLEKSTKIEALLAESHNLLDGIQTLEFLRDLLGKVGKKQHVSLLLSDNANFREIFNGMCENAATYDTDTLVELIELLHEYGVTSNDVLLQLVEELGSRMSGMSYHCQQQVLHLLTKLKVNHVSLLHGYRDTVSFTRSLNQNAMNKDTVGRAVVFLRNQYWSNELGKSLQDYVLANASELDLWSVSQILSVMIGKQLATRDIFMVCARTVTNILTRDIPVSDRCEVWGNFYPGVLNGLLRAFGKCKFCDEDLYHAFASLVEGAPDPYLQTSKFISNMSWSCGKVRFYSESLMDSIADHSLRGFPTFSNQDIAVLLYGFGALNCSHLDLFHTMVERVVGDEDHLTNHILCWTIVWVGMVLEQYPGNLLSRMLTDDFLTCKLS